MDMESIKTFLEVAGQESFTRAAEELKKAKAEFEAAEKERKNKVSEKEKQLAKLYPIPGSATAAPKQNTQKSK